MERFVVIDNKYVYFNHVASVKQTGRVFLKDGVQAMVITKDGKVPFELTNEGAFCRVHCGIFDDRKIGDAFVYKDGEWIRLVLDTVSFVAEKY